MTKKPEVFISVDIETAGPIVSEHSMMTIAACLVYEPEVNFSIMIKPISEMFIPEALEVTGLTLEQTEKEGFTPIEAMKKFSTWINSNVPKNYRPVFVGLNAPFDWSFINYYFLKYIEHNPFGISAIDIKAVFMGATGCSWYDTKSSSIDRMVAPSLEGNHDALADAKYQAELFRLVYTLSESKGRSLE